MSTALGLDIGTSGVKGLLIDETQAVLAEANAPLDVQRPQPGWSEQDPEDWWRATLDVVGQVRRAAPEGWRGLASIGLSGQMHGATLLDREGRSLRPAILWNDGRSTSECAELERRVPDFRRRAGNLAMPGFTAPKLIWVKRHEPEVFATTRTVLLPKDYVRYRLTGAFVSDMSDAAGTLWLDIARRRWDPDLLAACDLDEKRMPGLVEGSEPSAALLAEVVAGWGLAGRSVLVAGGGGDNAASAVGVGAVTAGEGFLSLGTSGVLFAATDRLRANPDRTLHAFCHALPGRWHVMAVTLSAASALSWAATLLGQADDLSRLLGAAEAFAQDPARRATAPLFLPYLTGERTPHNDAQATGSFTGLRAEHGPDALAYAVLEGVTFAFMDNLDVVTGAAVTLNRCMLVGGGARSDLWSQMLADALGLTLDRPAGFAAGAALGAARLALLADGATTQEVCVRPLVERSYNPRPERMSEIEPRLHRFRSFYGAEKALRAPNITRSGGRGSR